MYEVSATPHDRHLCTFENFLFRWGRADDGLGPECSLAFHTTSHLFDCPSFPTSFTVDDLWEKPWDAAGLLLPFSKLSLLLTFFLVAVEVVVVVSPRRRNRDRHLNRLLNPYMRLMSFRMMVSLTN